MPQALQGYLAHKKPPPPLGPPWETRHGPTVGSNGVAFSYQRGTPVQVLVLPGQPRLVSRARVGLELRLIDGCITQL